MFAHAKPYKIGHIHASKTGFFLGGHCWGLILCLSLKNQTKLEMFVGNEHSSLLVSTAFDEETC